jgi:hypothetical protein
MGVAEFLEKQILWWILMEVWLYTVFTMKNRKIPFQSSLPAGKAGLVNAGLCHYEGLQFAKNHQLC